MTPFTDIDALTRALQEAGYFADRRLATAVFLALKLQRPLLLEGEPGVGKTELAKALAVALQRQLLRLQCYDGLEQREALYEWNYAAQLLHMRAVELRAPTLGTGVSSLPPEGAASRGSEPASAGLDGTQKDGVSPSGGLQGLRLRPGEAGSAAPAGEEGAPVRVAGPSSFSPEGASPALGRPGGGGHSQAADVEQEVYQDRYLIRRPLLQALQAPAPGAVLLIDEVDRADEPFEAFLLEYLGEYQVSIPEIGTVRAQITPVTILTSNRTRELHDAVKRRCLYHWLDYPERERELAIVRSQVPQASEQLSAQVAAFVDKLRRSPLGNAFQRAPGIAESVEWAKALIALDTLVLDPEVVADTAGILFKQREDVAALTHELAVELLKPEEVA
jgi:MoxR-like ATPase